MATCTLCRKDAILRQSHYLPAAFYRRMHDKGKRVMPPVSLTKDRATYNVKQLKTALLCDECEHRIKIGGEDWAISCSALADGSFQLRRILEKSQPRANRARVGLLYYGADIKLAQHEKLFYFAASVLWRGAVFDWSLLDKETPQVLLPALMQEQLRLFLLGLGPKPPGLVISVEASVRPFLGIVFPTPLVHRQTNQEGAGYFFETYGLGFLMMFAQEEPSTRAIDTTTLPFPLILSSARSEELLTRFQELAQTAEATGALKRDWL